MVQRHEERGHQQQERPASHREREQQIAGTGPAPSAAMVRHNESEADEREAEPEAQSLGPYVGPHAGRVHVGGEDEGQAGEHGVALGKAAAAHHGERGPQRAQPEEVDHEAARRRAAEEQGEGQLEQRRRGWEAIVEPVPVAGDLEVAGSARQVEPAVEPRLGLPSVLVYGAVVEHARAAPEAHPGVPQHERHREKDEVRLALTRRNCAARRGP